MSRPSRAITNDDVHLFNEGSHYHLSKILGAHPGDADGETGTHFAVWAPDAEQIHVIGDFNGWRRDQHPLYPVQSSGIWAGFIAGVKPPAIYKYFIRSRYHGYTVEKADPVAFHAETPPKTGSIVWDLSYPWGDADWMRRRPAESGLDKPLSIYEVHLESWRRVPEERNRPLSYRELARELADYLRQANFTHVELLPVMEHPFSGSWGYQTTGYFAPTSRFGAPQDFMFFVDHLHQNGIGVILDWVPSHFPGDQHGLSFFDGTHLYEHLDERQGFHPDWKSWIFNYDRHEVRSFLISSALHWCETYHVDGLRVDAVASMLYLDYSREQGRWIPNPYGGNENLGAIQFLRRLNEVLYERCPGIQNIAEESTAWPGVSRPAYVGGLGFGFKWDMGWMHDMLSYMRREAIHRKYHHNALTFRMLYAWHENFVLALSHDEVAHGKGSLLAKMTGYDPDRFANLRALYGYMFAQPGKKLLFMGGEFAQWNEWNHNQSLDWHLLNHAPHQGMLNWIGDLNQFYRNEPALYETDADPAGFEWIDCNDSDSSVVSFLRYSKDRSAIVAAVFNFTPVQRNDYHLGLPASGFWREALNSDSYRYWGFNRGNFGGMHAGPWEYHGRPFSIFITLPPLSALYFKLER